MNYGLAQSVWGILPKVGQAIEKYPLLTEMGATAIANTGYQLSQDRPYDPYGLLQAELSTVLTRNRSLGQQVSLNTMLNVVATENSDDYGKNILGGVLGTVGSNVLGRFKIGNKYIDNIVSPVAVGSVNEYLSDGERLKKLHDYSYSLGDVNEK